MQQDFHPTEHVSAELESRPMPTWLVELFGRDEAWRTAFYRNARRRERAAVAHPPAARLVAEWWDALTATQREELDVSLDFLVGNLVGIPERVRSDANHRRIRRQLDQDESLADDPGVRSTLERLLDVTVIALNLRADEIVTYSGPLDQATGRIAPDLDVLGLYVPGSDANEHTFKYDLAKSEWFVQKSKRNIGMLTVMAGHHPRAQLTLESRGFEMLSDARARALAERLVHLVRSIAISDATETVAVGFSYGSLVLAWAEYFGMRVDRVLSVAGVGLGPLIRDGAFVGPPGTARYSIIAPDDDVVSGGVSGALAGIFHGVRPDARPEYISIEPGYIIRGLPASGPVRGHTDGGMWRSSSDAMQNMLAIIEAGEVFLDRLAGEPPRLAPVERGSRQIASVQREIPAHLL